MTLISPPIDKSALYPILSQFADETLYQELILQFVNGLTADMYELKEAVSRRQCNKVSLLAHRIKGTAATFGYPDLAAVSSSIEQFTSQINTAHLSETDSLLLSDLIDDMLFLKKCMLAGLQTAGKSTLT